MSSASPPPPQIPVDAETPPSVDQHQHQLQHQYQHQHQHQHHLRTRFRARLVRESLHKRATKLLCSAFLSLLVAVGVVLFVVWLALRPHRPRFHLTSFSASVISAPAGAPSSLAFSFGVSIRNPNQDIGIYYGALSASVFYGDDRVGTAAAPLAGPFFQPRKNTTAVTGTADGTPTPAVAGMIATDAAGGSVGFRLVLASAIHFQVSSWLDTRRHRAHVSCDVEVGPDGAILAASRDRRCSIYFL